MCVCVHATGLGGRCYTVFETKLLIFPTPPDRPWEPPRRLQTRPAHRPIHPAGFLVIIFVITIFYHTNIIHYYLWMFDCRVDVIRKRRRFGRNF